MLFGQDLSAILCVLLRWNMLGNFRRFQSSALLLQLSTLQYLGHSLSSGIDSFSAYKHSQNFLPCHRSLPRVISVVPYDLSRWNLMLRTQKKWPYVETIQNAPSYDWEFIRFCFSASFITRSSCRFDFYLWCIIYFCAGVHMGWSRGGPTILSKEGNICSFSRVVPQAKGEYRYFFPILVPKGPRRALGPPARPRLA